MCIFALICTSVAYGIAIIALSIAVIFAIMSVLYIKNKLYLNRIINGIFIVIVIFITYLYGMSYKKIPSINSYIDSYNGVNAKATGTVSDITVKETYTQILLRGVCVTISTDVSNELENTIQHKKQTVNNVTILANTNDTSIKKGDIVNIAGTLKTFECARNEGNFDSKIYYRSIGVDYKFNVKNIEIVDNKRCALLKELDIIKEKQKLVYTSIANDDDAGVFISMVLGDKSLLGAEIKQLYQKNGISHLLAISGLHISLIGMLIYNILRKLRQSFLISSSVSVFVIVCYAIMTGNSISTRRAVIMLVISLGAQVVGRTYDIITALSISAIILMYDNPYVIENSAFQLSFGAVVGITLVYPALKFLLIYTNNEIKYALANNIKAINICKNNKVLNYILKKISIIIDMLLISISVNIVTIPIVMFNYFEVPPYSIILNLIVVPLMSLLMVCAVFAGVIGLFSINIATFVIGVSHYILAIYDMLCRCVQKLPYSIVVTGRPDVKNITIYYAIIIVFITIVNIIQYIKQNDNINKKCKIIKDKSLYVFKYNFIYVLLFMAFAILVSRNDNNFELDMIDVGQGDSIFMQTPDSKTYLFDGGSTDINEVGKYRIMPFLKSKKVTSIDCVTISHSDADHINAIVELIQMTGDTFSIKKIVLPDIKNKLSDKSYCELEKKAIEYGIEIEYISTGDIIFNGIVSKIRIQ